MLKNYPEGSDITLLNTMYNYAKKDPNTNKYGKDCLTVVYRDNTTGKKHKEEIEAPTYNFFYAKDDVRIDNHELFLEKDKLNEIEVPYNSLEKTIAELTGNMDFYNDNIKSGNRYANKKLHTHSRVFLSDSDIQDHFRFNFDNKYLNNSYKLKKTFFDIEADVIDAKGDFVEMGECPVNAITIINDFDNKVYTLLLRDSNNPLIEQFEKSISPIMFDKLRNTIMSAVGGRKKYIKFGLDKLEFEFMFYDEEIKLIHDLFRLINVRKPDFVLAWNMAFDIPYLIERIKVLGYDPAEIMSHPDFEHKFASYWIDERNINENAERGDRANIASYSVFLCQMIQFASRRKSSSAFQSFKLDYIGKVVTGVRKLDYSHVTTKLAELPWKDYELFVFYNIIDTIVQRCIEDSVGDIDYIFNKCLMNNTRYDKGHRQTVYLVNRGIKEFYKDDLVMGNNNNKYNEKPTTKFPGAFVADPRKNSDYAKVKINGQPCNLFNNGDDFDYKSLYPSQMREFNMAPNTQIGKIFIQEPRKGENKFNNPYYDRGGSFIEDLHSWNYISFCNRWLGFASYSELCDDIIEYFTKVCYTQYDVRNSMRVDGFIHPIRPLENNMMVRPITHIDKNEMVNPISKFYGKPDYQMAIKDIDISEVIYYDN